jgi:hypothetical protein
MPMLMLNGRRLSAVAKPEPTRLSGWYPVTAKVAHSLTEAPRSQSIFLNFILGIIRLNELRDLCGSVREYGEIDVTEY